MIATFNSMSSRARKLLVAAVPASLVLLGALGSPTAYSSVAISQTPLTCTTTGSGGSLAANSTRLDTGTTVYQATFVCGAWSGDVAAYPVDPQTGQIYTAAQCTPALCWHASVPAWSSRNIYFNNGTTPPAGGMPLTPTGAARFNSTNVTAAFPLTASTLFAPPATAVGGLTYLDVVDYLQGNTQKEANNKLRPRSSLIGDIVNSQPVYVGAPNGRLYVNADFPGSNNSGVSNSYGNFVTAQTSRTPVVYVGSNDGMLHGFNATNGTETFAFIPAAVINAGLNRLADPAYQHQYFVDGELTVADVYVSGAWRTILVGTMGRGGRDVFALDVTNPSAVKFLWEKDQTTVPALGNNLGKPIIAQVDDGDWRVLMGNGPNSASDTASLLVFDVMTGAALTYPVGTATNNGLTAVQAWDASGSSNGYATRVYAGDMLGNMWRINLDTISVSSNGTSVTYAPSTPALLFSTSGKPITAAPLVGQKPGTSEIWVFFGTGRYLSQADVDLNNPGQQTWYGMRDDGTTVSATNLIQRNAYDVTTSSGGAARVVDGAVPGDMAGYSGWYINLPDMGERMIVPNQFEGFALIGTSRFLDSSSTSTSPVWRGVVTAVDPFTGGGLSNNFFDINGDGRVNESDSVTNQAGNQTSASGVILNNGTNNPTFTGDVMQLSLDDASRRSVQTNASMMNLHRVTWREVLGDP